MAINRLNPDYPDAGSVQLIPTSVAVGSGSSTVNGNGSVDFSGASSVSLNDVFSSVYENYCLIINNISSAADEILRLRLRVSGSDASGANYAYQTLNALGTTVSAGRGTSQTSWDIFRNDTTYNGGVAYIFRPNIAATTQYTSSNAWSLEGARISLNGGSHSLTTAYTGFTLVPNSGTITGTIRVYGLRN